MLPPLEFENAKGLEVFLNSPTCQARLPSSLLLSIWMPGTKPLLNGPSNASWLNDRSMKLSQRLLVRCS